LIGFRAGRVGVIAAQNPNIKRRNIASTLTQLNSPAEHLFGNGKIFDEERTAQWPTYLFGVRDKSISILKRNVDLGQINKRPTLRPRRQLGMFYGNQKNRRPFKRAANRSSINKRYNNR
jgi:hypothetical protein